MSKNTGSLWDRLNSYGPKKSCIIRKKMYNQEKFSTIILELSLESLETINKADKQQITKIPVINTVINIT